MSVPPLGFLIEYEAWMEQGACRGANPDLFILKQGFTGVEGKKYCDVCTVTEECLSYAKRTNSVGVWGGKLFTFRYSEPQEIVPYQPVMDARPVKIILTSDGPPSILGKRSRPSILGR